MFLKNIHIHNFRCLNDIKLSFNEDNGRIRKTTLILGENGTGKSNFIKAIAIITSGTDAFPMLVDDVDSLITNGKNESFIKATLVTQQGERKKYFH